MTIAVGVLFISISIPLIFLIFIRSLDFYRTGRFNYIILTLLWGMVVCLVVGPINSSLVAYGWASQEDVARLIAPVLEELLKALILFHYVSLADFNYVVDGASYGFFTGIGFAMVETFGYLISAKESALFLAVSRALSSNLVHAATSALVGSGLAWARLEKGRKKAAITAISLTAGIALHTSYNWLTYDTDSFLLAIAIGLLSFCLVTLIIIKSLDIQRQWISEVLGMRDRVTSGEAEMVNRLSNLDEVLAPITKQFGPEKAALTASLLQVQAEIGIKRKLAESAADEQLRARIENEINYLTEEMNSLRKTIGVYCMLFVRSVYLKQGNDLWGLINTRVGAAGKDPARSGLWSALENRVKQ